MVQSDIVCDSMMFVNQSVVYHTVLLIVISDIVFSFMICFNQDGRTSLLWAAEKGHADVIEKLLAAKPNIEAKTNVSKIMFT